MIPSLRRRILLAAVGASAGVWWGVASAWGGGAQEPCSVAARVAAVQASDRRFLDVEIVHADGTVERARRGSTLCDFDRIRVGFGSSATLDFRGEAIVRVGGLSGVYVGGFRLGRRSELELWVRAGEAAVEARRPVRLRIVTPTATVETGGWVRVSYDQIAKASVVGVHRGAARVEPTEGPLASPVPRGLPRVRLGAGSEVRVSAVAVSRVAALGRAGVPSGWPPRAAGRAAVEAILERNRPACRMTVDAITVRAGAAGWIVSAKLMLAGRTGSGTWIFVGTEIEHTNRFATYAGRGCR